MGDSVFGKFSVAVVTPFIDSKVSLEQPVDFSSFDSIVNHVAIGLSKVSKLFDEIGGIIVSGTTGEQHTMTFAERAQLYKCAVDRAKEHSISVVAGIASTTSSGAVGLAVAAVNAGCEGIMLGLPPYCRLSDDEISDYILTVKAAVPDTLPILLYNNVMRNGYGPSCALLARLTADGTLWGVKHAVLPADFLSHANELIALNPAIRLYTGGDKVALELLNPGKTAADQKPLFYGLTSILGNLDAEWVGRLVAQAANLPLRNNVALNQSEDKQRDAEVTPAIISAEKQTHFVALADAVLVGCSLPVGLKYAMRSRGLSAGYTRLPVGHLSAEKKEEIDGALRTWAEDKTTGN